MVGFASHHAEPAMNVYSREEFAAVPRNAEDVELYIYRPYG